MGIWYSSPSKVVFPEQTKVEPTAAPTAEPDRRILIRHRPTCLSTELEKGVAELQEKAASADTNPQ
jgi:hypothetical protein